MVLRHHRWKPYSRYGIVNRNEWRELINKLVAEYDVRCSSIESPASTLSGGNLQKLILARETFSGPKLLIAEQPMRGLDVNAINFVRELLLRQRDEKRALLLISADLDEILALADRIVVMFEGRIVYRCQCPDIDIKKIGLAMSGFEHGKHHEEDEAFAGVSGEEKTSVRC
jgi:simple sugar transport system ATP-binding protein